MSLETEVMVQLKDAMKSKNEGKLRSLRAIKAELIKAKTNPGAEGKVSVEEELNILQKMIKERRDSIEIYVKQNRKDLSDKESEEIDVIASFLPQQLSDEDLNSELTALIKEVNAQSAKEMGKVMGLASSRLKGKAEGKRIADMVRQLLA